MHAGVGPGGGSSRAARVLPPAGPHCLRRARWNPGGRTLELLLRSGAGTAELETLLRCSGVERLEPALPALAALVEDGSLSIARAELREDAAGAQLILEFGGECAVAVACARVDVVTDISPGPDYGDPQRRFDILSC